MFKLMREPVSYQISARINAIKANYSRMGDFLVMNKKPKNAMLEVHLSNLYNTYGYEKVRQVYMEVYFESRGAL